MRYPHSSNLRGVHQIDRQDLQDKTEHSRRVCLIAAIAKRPARHSSAIQNVDSRTDAEDLEVLI